MTIDEALKEPDMNDFVQGLQEERSRLKTACESEPKNDELKAKLAEVALALYYAETSNHPGEGWEIHEVVPNGDNVWQRHGELERKHGRPNVKVKSIAFDAGAHEIKGAHTIFIKSVLATTSEES